jgi:hypothetical protein
MILIGNFFNESTGNLQSNFTEELMMKLRNLIFGLFVLSNAQSTAVQAQSTSEQMRYAQQQQKWRSQEIHNDVHSRMDAARKRMEEARIGSSSSFTNSTLTAPKFPKSDTTSHMSGSSQPSLKFDPVPITNITKYPGNPEYLSTSSSSGNFYGSIAKMLFVTRDVPRQVYSFYAKDLPQHGWKFNTSKCNGQKLVAVHEKDNRQVTIKYAPTAGGTTVELDYSQALLLSGKDPLSNLGKSGNLSNLGNNERVKMNNSSFKGIILPGSNLDSNERIQRGLK